jgi:hypothetical protein
MAAVGLFKKSNVIYVALCLFNCNISKSVITYGKGVQDIFLYNVLSEKLSLR